MGLTSATIHPENLASGEKIDPRPDSEEELTERGLVIWAVGLLLGVAVALCCLWPFLVREHARLGPWKGVCIWLADAAPLVVFLCFAFKRVVLGPPLKETHDPSQRHTQWKVVLAGVGISLGVDWWITLSVMQEEKAAFATARTVQGELVAVDRRDHEGYVTYGITCSFLDAAGEGHQAWFQIIENPKVGSLQLPEEIAANVRQGKVPSPVTLTYDPSRPSRNWITATGWHADNRLYFLSLFLLIGQALFIPFFLPAMLRASAGASWRRHLGGAMIVSFQIFFFAFVGVLYRLGVMEF